jgi:hypothetical protein
MKQLDGWIGEIVEEVDKPGIADGTVIVIMGDNGHFTKDSPGSGFTPMIFRGGKGDSTEGGVRVDARGGQEFARIIQRHPRRKRRIRTMARQRGCRTMALRISAPKPMPQRRHFP